MLEIYLTFASIVGVLYALDFWKHKAGYTLTDLALSAKVIIIILIIVLSGLLAPFALWELFKNWKSRRV